VSKVYVLMFGGGQYSERFEDIEAISHDKQKLEDLAKKLDTERKLASKIYDEVNNDMHRYHQTYKYNVPVPKEIAKGTPNRKSIEQENYTKYYEGYQQWLNAYAIPAKQKILAKYNLPPDYELTNYPDGTYDILEFKEI